VSSLPGRLLSMKARTCSSFTRTNASIAALRAECPAEAISPTPNLPEEVAGLNAEYAKTWADITVKEGSARRRQGLEGVPASSRSSSPRNGPG